MTDPPPSARTRTEERVIDLLAEIIDPEMRVNIVDLGLVRRVDASDDGARVHVVVTLTSPACPVADSLVTEVERAAAAAEGVEAVHVELELDPPWDPRRDATEEGLDQLGIFEL